MEIQRIIFLDQTQMRRSRDNEGWVKFTPNAVLNGDQAGNIDSQATPWVFKKD